VIKKAIMHFYWRITEELKYLGELIVFHDPGLSREYQRWTGKNCAALEIHLKDYHTDLASAINYSVFLPCMN